MDSTIARVMFDYPESWVFVGKIVGYITTETAQGFFAAAAKSLRHPRKAHLFFELSEITAYDTGARRYATGWLQSNEQSIEAPCVLVTSALMRMGAAVVNTGLSVLGKREIEIVKDRASFDAAIKRACRR